MTLDILSTQDLLSLRRLIDGAESVVAVCHRSPDGDALGAVIGFAEWLRGKGKTVYTIVPDAYPDFLHWLPCSDKLLRYDRLTTLCDSLIASASLIVCLDFNTLSRTSAMELPLRNATAPKVLIDHHLAPDVSATVSVSAPEASSTCELVFRIVRQVEMAAVEAPAEQAESRALALLSRRASTALYCGMMTDTGCFSYNCSRPEVFYIVSKLLEKQVNKDKIYSSVYNNYSASRLKLMGYVLHEKLHLTADNKAAYYTLTAADLKTFNYIKGDTEGLVNMPLQIRSVRLCVSLREDTERPNTVWVSLRSKDNVPCNLMAERYFNGGGHLNASGGRLNCSMAEAEEHLVRALAEFCADEVSCI